MQQVAALSAQSVDWCSDVCSGAVQVVQLQQPFNLQHPRPPSFASAAGQCLEGFTGLEGLMGLVVVLGALGSHGARNGVLCSAGVAEMAPLEEPTCRRRWEGACVPPIPPILTVFAERKACGLQRKAGRACQSPARWSLAACVEQPHSESHGTTETVCGCSICWACVCVWL